MWGLHQMNVEVMAMDRSGSVPVARNAEAQYLDEQRVNLNRTAFLGLARDVAMQARRQSHITGDKSSEPKEVPEAVADDFLVNNTDWPSKGSSG